MCLLAGHRPGQLGELTYSWIKRGEGGKGGEEGEEKGEKKGEGPPMSETH